MALDHALRDRADADGTTVLRLYQWSDDTISFGANEAACRHWDRARIEQEGIPTVRRPTGGRAVWHDSSDLTYAVTGSTASFGGVRAAYDTIHRGLAAAFSCLGHPAVLASAPRQLPGLRRGACFDVAVGGEVMIGDTKVIGSAQVVSRDALLQHGAIARGDRVLPLTRYRHDGDEMTTSPVRWPVLPTAALIAEAIIAEWETRGGQSIPPELTRWADAASVKHKERYCDPLWTWRR
jgi:lipoate-protein ligase A